MLTCSDDSCTTAVYLRGLCKYHYYSKLHVKRVKEKALFVSLVRKAQSESIRERYLKKEAYIVCELFALVQEMGLFFIPQYKDMGARYDGLILTHDTPLAIIEVKGDRGKVGKAQLEKYQNNSFKVPVILVEGRKDIQHALYHLKVLAAAKKAG